MCFFVVAFIHFALFQHAAALCVLHDSLELVRFWMHFVCLCVWLITMNCALAEVKLCVWIGVRFFSFLFFSSFLFISFATLSHKLVWIKKQRIIVARILVVGFRLTTHRLCVCTTMKTESLSFSLFCLWFYCAVFSSPTRLYNVRYIIIIIIICILVCWWLILWLLIIFTVILIPH